MIRAASPDEVRGVAGRLGLPFSDSMRGITNGGALVLFDGWTPNAVQAHIYSEAAAYLLQPEFIREIFMYPFIQCQKNLIYTVTPAECEESLALSKALGFRETYRIPDGWKPGIDMVVKEMRREECRYLKVH